MEAAAAAVVHAAAPEVQLFWDGACPLCRKEIAYYKGLDGAGRVDWVDLAERPAALEERGVSEQQALKLIHAIDADGSLRVGVPAFLAVWQRLPYWRVLPPLLRALPGALPAASALYAVFARYRFRITGRARGLGEGSACGVGEGSACRRPGT
jgi:predicted DCC family thiol-disulfide oxidoreductase YuxK